MFNGEFKTVIIRILTGLEKRVKDISQTIDTEIRNNTAEIKDSVNEMENILDRINNRLEGAGEQKNDLEHRVMESNQAEKIRGNGIMQNVNRLRELNDSIKGHSIHVIGVPERDKREKRDRTFI